MRLTFPLFAFSLCLITGVPALAQETAPGPAQPPAAATPAPEAAKDAVKEAPRPAPSPEAIALGKTLLAATVKAHGGDAFLSVKSLKASGKGVAHAPEEAGGLEIPLDALTVYLAAPDRARMEMETGFGLIVAGRPGGSKVGWVKIGDEIQNDPNDNGVGLIPVTVLVQAIKENYAVAALTDDKPVTTAAGKKLVGFALTDPKGREIRMYVEEETKLLRRVERTLPSGIASMDMDGYREYKGASLPGSIKLKQAGKEVLALSFVSFEVNPQVDDSLFERPKPKSEAAK